MIVQIFKPLETDNDTFDGNKIGEIPGFTSYTYTKHWQRPGTFELTFISGSSADETKIAEDTVLLVDGDWLIVAGVKPTDTMTTVTGYDFKGYLKQRITLFAEEQDTGAQGYDVISGSTETVMKHYIQNNASEPSDASRKIPGMTVAEDGQRGLEADSYMARLENLSDVEESICTNADVGYTVDADSYTVEAGSIEEYGTDYSLGDVVTVKDIARGKSVDKVITQAVKSISGAEKSLKLTFGDQKRKLLSGINENVERAMRDIKKIVMDKAAKEDVKQAAQGIKSESEKLSELMANALGVYRTIQSSEDGSEVYYLHDAPTMAESTVIWEFNAGAFAVSTDGGQTWNSGVTADGSIVTKIIETTKIVSDVKSELAGQIGEVQSKIAEIDLNAEDISLKVQNILDNGVDKVVTELLGSGRRRLRRELQKHTGKSARQIKRLLKQAAETSYGDDIRRLSAGIPFEKNDNVQQIIAAESKLADESFRNITQTLGFVDPYGHASELTDAYRKCCDFAFNQVAFGATDYNTAVRQATKNLADKGVRVIDYDSGTHTSAEAAVRRNIMSGLGSMNEKISEQNHDDMGANGWEISAHAASAPDHELIQGRQYTDAAYQRLNNSLVRRIGTLNCGHTAFPIVLGVSQPQYTDAQLEQIRQDNATGVTVNGRHYTTYEATQQQRAMERTMRKQKRRIVVDEAAGDDDKLLTDRIRLGQQNAQYKAFSRAAGLRTQEARADAAGFGAKQGAAADKSYRAVVKAANSMYDIGSEEQNVKAYMRDLPIRKKIQSGEIPSNIEAGQQRKHIHGTLEYQQYVEKLRKKNEFGPSRITITDEELNILAQEFKGTGILKGKYVNGSWVGTETITMNEKVLGTVVNNVTGAEAETSVFKIHYGTKGIHIVPDYPSKKGAKAKS